jgi:putative DNA primase/helicase
MMTLTTVQQLMDTAIPAEVVEATTIAPLRSLNLRELLALDIPPRDYILAPWLPSQGLVMIYAPRGIGKTMVALEIAVAVAAGGSFLSWQALKARSVLYLDGEMPLVAMQERMARILKNAVEQPDPNRLRLVSPDLQDYGLTLATETGRQRIEPLLEGVELVIVDNISTLAACGRENEAESWLPLQDWALSLRRRGISVLFIHHAGKGGTQRGTSRREDVLDTVIALRPPKDYDPRNGAQFEVHFEKARGLMGEAVAPFKAQLTENGWLTQTLDDAREQEVGTLSAEGLSQRDIAAELGISPATVNRILKKAKEKK